jgi:predicted transcriptional regulator
MSAIGRLRAYVAQVPPGLVLTSVRVAAVFNLRHSTAATALRRLELCGVLERTPTPGRAIGYAVRVREGA